MIAGLFPLCTELGERVSSGLGSSFFLAYSVRVDMDATSGRDRGIRVVI
jgi:hypothetical protein